MDKFLKTYKLPKLTQEEIENLSRPVSSKEVESVIKNIPVEIKAQACVTSLVNSTKHQCLTSMRLKLFQKTAEEGMLPNSSYEPRLSQQESNYWNQKSKWEHANFTEIKGLRESTSTMNTPACCVT